MLTEAQIEQFDRDGYLVIENYYSTEICNKLRNECDKLIDSEGFLDEVNKLTGEKDEEKMKSEYFITSSDKIRAFLEPKANEVIEKCKAGNVEYHKRNIFNRIGHAMHALNPVFKEATFTEEAKSIFKSLGYITPTVCQSLYIFKQPFIGGEVQIHQDASYLYAEPCKLAGIWIALEDCDPENGCLQFIPGSNKWPLGRKFMRNPNKEEFDSGKFLVYDKEDREYNDADFVHVPVKKGDALIIDGNVVHRSGSNFSARTRHAYTFHVYDAGYGKWADYNWPAYSEASFLPLY